MGRTDDAWHLVKITPKVTGFVGGAHGRKQPLISEKEVKNNLQQMQEGVEKPKPKVLFEIGEAVRVREGPFTDFHGTVEDVNYDKSKLRVRSEEHMYELQSLRHLVCRLLLEKKNISRVHSS